MEQENKIEELKETMGRIINDAMYHILDEYDSRYLAEELYAKGYRKADEVAREIFEEISKASADWGCYCMSAFKWGYVTTDVSHTLAELKKKYTEEQSNDG